MSVVPGKKIGGYRPVVPIRPRDLTRVVEFGQQSFASSAMEPQAAARQQDLKRQRRDFEMRLAEIYEEDDPLAVYVQYVQWIVNNYSEDDPTSGLQPLLRKATDAFKHDSLYKTDLRYLKLWTLYARHLEHRAAIEVYVSLLKNEIGSSYALLYEKYAELLEASGQ